MTECDEERQPMNEWSHRGGFTRHFIDGTYRRSVTAELKGRGGMEKNDWLAAQFEAERPHLRAVAYRMLGSLPEAEDAVQEGWLHLSRSDEIGIGNLRGWLTTVVARICLDMLRSRKSRREERIGLVVQESGVAQQDRIDAHEELLLADSVGQALLIVLDTLSPAGRVRGLEPALVKGAVGAGARRGHQVLVFRLAIMSGKIVEIHVVADPEHLRHLDLVILDSGVERAPSTAERE